MASSLAVYAAALISINTVFAALPGYLMVCKKNDSSFDACVPNCLESLKPKLREGIPELHMPPLEPLKLGDLIMRFNTIIAKASAKDYIVRGASNFELGDFKSDLSNNSLRASLKLRFPKVTLVSIFEVNSKILNRRYRGKGPLTVETEGTNVTVTIKGKRTQKGGQNYEFIMTDPVDLKLNWENYESKLGEEFFKDPAVTEAFNAAFNNNKRHIIDLMTPQVTSIVKDVVSKVGMFRLIPKIILACY